MLFTVEDLIADAPPVVAVEPNDAVITAHRRMLENDYSQLPVADRHGNSLGKAVTFRGILNALSGLGTTLDKLIVDDVMVPAREVRVDADLLTILDDIQDESFLLIVDAERQLKGIITTFDTTAHFRRYAEDLMVVEDVETMLREAIRALYTDKQVSEEIQKVVDKKYVALEGFKRGLAEYAAKIGFPLKEIDETLAGEAFSIISQETPKDFEKLTFNELAELLLRHPNSPRPALADGVRELRRLLHAVRDTRNDLAHFRGEIVQEKRENLRYCSDWLSRHLPNAKEVTDKMSTASDEVLAKPAPTEEKVESPNDEPIPAGDSTYAGLAVFLNAQPSQISSKTLSFDEVENIIQYKLPKSARAHRAWWANNPSHPQAAQWLDVGWRAQSINMNNERVTFARIAEREEAYIYFFNAVMNRLRSDNTFPLKNISPQGASWHIFADFLFGKPNTACLNASFTRHKMLRVEVYLDCADAAETKRVFDLLYSHRESIEQNLADLSWERMDEKRASRIAIYTAGSITGEPVALDRLANWAATTVLALYRVFKPQFEAL